MRFYRTPEGHRLYAARRGNAYHDEMFDRIALAREANILPPNVRFNTGRMWPGLDPFNPLRPDIRVPLGGRSVAIWDLTTVKQQGKAGVYDNPSVMYLAELLY
jgi:hypothetical protein